MLDQHAVTGESAGTTASSGWDGKFMLWLILFTLVLFTRFYHLDARPFHHDESYYAKYIWNYYTGSGYLFDPMGLGPFLFHFGQIPLVLFGVSNFTMRMGPAITGFLLVLTLFFSRRVWCEITALIAAGIFVLDPAFMYYQRFLRQDAYYSLLNVAAFLALAGYLKTRKIKHFLLFSCFAASMSTSKFEAYWFFGILTSFSLLVTIQGAWRKVEGNRLWFRSVSWNIRQYPLMAATTFSSLYWGTAFCFYALLYLTVKYKFYDWSTWVHVYWWFILTLFFTGLILLSIRTFGDTRKHARTLLMGSLGFISVYALLYTSCFTNLPGFMDGIFNWFVYWSHQHAISRISGPAHHYIHLILIYGILPASVVSFGILYRFFRITGIWIFTGSILIFAAGLWYVPALPALPHITCSYLVTNTHLFAAVILSAVLAVVTLGYLAHHTFLNAFLVWWICLNGIFYCILVDQKVPWFLVNLMTPVILLGAIYLADFLRTGYSRWIKYPIYGILGIMVLYTIHTSVLACWRTEADPVEKICYVHTSRDITRILDNLEELAFYTNQDKSVPVVVTGHATWPFYWYLRDWTNISYGSHVDSDRHLMVICNWEDRYKFRKILGDNFIVQKGCLREWWEPDPWNLAAETPVKDIWHWIMYREMFREDLHGCQEIAIFIRAASTPRSPPPSLRDRGRDGCLYLHRVLIRYFRECLSPFPWKRESYAATHLMVDFLPQRC